MKKKISTILLVTILMVAMAMPTFAFTQGFNLDDFKMNPGASIAVIDEPELYNGKALQGDERDDDGATHFSTINFSVPADGKYGLWFLVWAENETCNSLLISIDGGEIFTCDYMESNEQPNPEFEYYEIWYWMWLNSRQEIMDENDGMGFDGFNAYLTDQKKFVDLKAGEHTIKIITREPFAKYDGMIITDDLNYDPNTDAALQVGKVDPASVYPDPAIAAAAAAAEAEAAALAAAEAAAAVVSTVTATSPQTGDSGMIVIAIFAISALIALTVVGKRKIKG